jgi:hypothetical protein
MLVRLEYQNTAANRTSSTRFSDRTVEFFLSGLALRATPQTLSRVPPLPPSTTPPPELAPQHNLRASKEGGGGAPPSPLLSPTALATVSGGGGVPFSCGLGQRRWPGGDPIGSHPARGTRRSDSTVDGHWMVPAGWSRGWRRLRGMEGGVGSLGDRRGLGCSPPPPLALAPAVVRALA